MTQKIGVFDVLGTIGKGAGSAILKVRRKADGKTYALKVVTVHSADDKKYLEQAEHEYLVASRLDHPNLLKAYGFEWTRKLFRVRGAKVLLEYVDGLVLSECCNLPMAALVRTFFKTAEGLAYMHAHGYYHADIKPDNIMVMTNGDVKIIDFGLVWRRGQKKDRVQGTLEFLAPEQAKKRMVNAKTDIFNLGATMYRVVTGKAVPAELRQPGSSKLGIDAIIPPVTKLNPEAPAGLDDLVRQCIRIKPDERPKTMLEVAARLDELLPTSSGR